MLPRFVKYPLRYKPVMINLLSNRQENMSVKCIPLKPRFYIEKTGVSRDIPIFLIFAPKHG